MGTWAASGAGWGPMRQVDGTSLAAELAWYQEV